MQKKKYIAIVFSLLFLDQLTKFAISNTLKLFQEKIIIKDFFSLLYIRNDGAAFSMFKGQIWLFYVMTFVALLIVFYLYKNSKTELSLVATSILLAGILGNFIDRILFQEVIDFFNFTFFGYEFATFNLADAWISIAVVLFVIDTIKTERKVS